MASPNQLGYRSLQPLSLLHRDLQSIRKHRPQATSLERLELNRPGAQAPQDAVQNALLVLARNAANFRRQKWFDHRPLEIRRVKARHLNLQGRDQWIRTPPTSGIWTKSIFATVSYASNAFVTIDR